MEKTYIVKVAAGGRVEREEFRAEDALAQLQAAVGGYIERVPIPMVKGHDLFVDEDGIGKRLAWNVPLSLVARNLTHNPCYGIVGNGVYAAHDGEGETIGLTKDECESIEQMLVRHGATIAGREVA